MKKILAIMLALMLCLTAFVACGDNKDNVKPTDEKPAENNEEPAENNEEIFDVNADVSSDAEEETDEGDYIVSGDYVFDENGVVVDEIDEADGNDEEVDYVDFYSESDLVGSWVGEAGGVTGTITFTEDGTLELSAEGETNTLFYEIREGSMIYVTFDGSEWDVWSEIYLADETELWLYTEEDGVCFFERADAVTSEAVEIESYDTFTKEMFIGSWTANVYGIELTMEFSEDDVLNMSAAGEVESGTYKIENNAIYFSEDGGATWDPEVLPVSSMNDDTFIVEEDGFQMVFERN